MMLLNFFAKTARSARQQSGFSMIEMMAAVAILAIAVSAAVPGFTQFVANTQIRSTTESIRNGLQLARSEAVKRNAQVKFTILNDTSWVVGCTTPVVDVCPAVIQSKTANESAANSIALTFTGTKEIAFTNLGTVTPAAGQLSVVNVDHKTLSASETRDLRLLVGTGGGVRMCDPNVSATTDTRKC